MGTFSEHEDGQGEKSRYGDADDAMHVEEHIDEEQCEELDDSEDDSDDEDDDEDSESVVCPFCGAVDEECKHCFADVDLTDGQIYAGTFVRHIETVQELLTEPMYRVVTMLEEDPAKTLDTLGLPYRLEQLVEDTCAINGPSVGFEDFSIGSGWAFCIYLEDIFADYTGAVCKNRELDGASGCTSLSHMYWTRDPEKCVADALAAVRKDAAFLESLVK